MAPSRTQAKGRQGAKMALPVDSDTADAMGTLKSLRETLNQLNNLRLSKTIQAPRIVLIGTAFECNKIVLESLSRMPFPVNIPLQIQFTTELVLKPADQTGIHVIAPDQSFDGFSRTGFPPSAFPTILEELKSQMRIGAAGSIANQVLQIEICGPDLPDLTMVELANLGRGDSLPAEYLKQDSSIILAIYSGDGDLNSPSELDDQIREHDPKRTRTFKVVTMPEKLNDNASQSPLNNPEEWHVLPGNPSPESTTNDTEAKLDVSRQGRWSEIPPQNWGSENLQKKINTALLDNIRHRLPKSAGEINQLILQHKTRLEDLGNHRKYLVKIASSYHKLAHEALQGNYADSFFGSVSSDDSSALSYQDRCIKKFRALVKNLNRAFSHVMVTKGHQRRVLIGFEIDEDDDDIDENEGLDPSSFLAPLVELYDVERPISVSMRDLESELQTIALENEGTGFTNSVHDILALRLFRDQIRPWKTIAKRHVELLAHFAHCFAEKLVRHSAGCDTKTADALIKEYIVPYFDRKSIELEAKLDELLFHYQHGYDFQQLYGAGPQLSRQTAHQPGNAILSLEGSSEDADASRLDANKIVTNMETYYEIALRVFIDNVAVLAAENCLIRDIPNIISLDTVYGISDKESQRLATESRDELKNQLTKLETVLAACQAHQPQKSNTISRNLPLLRPPSERSRSGTPRFTRASASPALSATACPSTPTSAPQPQPRPDPSVNSSAPKPTTKVETVVSPWINPSSSDSKSQLAVADGVKPTDSTPATEPKSTLSDAPPSRPIGNLVADQASSKSNPTAAKISPPEVSAKASTPIPTSAPVRGGLFGGSSTPAPAPAPGSGSSLFGASSTPAPAPAPVPGFGGAFGASSTPAPARVTAFGGGGFGASSTPAPAPAPARAPAAGFGSSSLFGASSTPAPAAARTLFGASSVLPGDSKNSTS